MFRREYGIHVPTSLNCTYSGGNLFRLDYRDTGGFVRYSWPTAGGFYFAYYSTVTGAYTSGSLGGLYSCPSAIPLTGDLAVYP
jgi:hypothetical protein